MPASLVLWPRLCPLASAWRRVVSGESLKSAQLSLDAELDWRMQHAASLPPACRCGDLSRVFCDHVAAIHLSTHSLGTVVQWPLVGPRLYPLPAVDDASHVAASRSSETRKRHGCSRHRRGLHEAATSAVCDRRTHCTIVPRRSGSWPRPLSNVVAHIVTAAELTTPFTVPVVRLGAHHRGRARLIDHTTSLTTANAARVLSLRPAKRCCRDAP